MVRRLLVGVCLLVLVSVPASAQSRVVSFASSDGITLRGRQWGDGHRAVVLSHMYRTDQSVWSALAPTLARAGYRVLTYDFRGVGRSGGRLVIGQVDRDVLAAIRYVRAQGARQVFLIGASMGGTASLVAAGQTRVDGVVVLASGTQFAGLNARPHLAGLTVPKLFIVGSGDSPFIHSARFMYERTPHPKHLVVIPSAEHGTYLLQSKHRATIERAIVEFLKKYANS